MIISWFLLYSQSRCSRWLNEALTIVDADKINKPLIQAIGFIEVIAGGVRAINKIFKKEG
jgi:hypothetical protein